MNIFGYSITLIFGLTSEQKILDGRKVVNTYREDHSKMYVGGKLVNDKHHILLSALLDELGTIGFTGDDRINDFFNKSNVYNMKQLGFNDKEDFNNNATLQNAEDYFSMWK